MKNLRVQFVFLIIGILLIPTLTGIGTFSFIRAYTGKDSFNMEIVMSILREVSSRDSFDEIEISESVEQPFTDRNGKLFITERGGDTVYAHPGESDDFGKLVEEDGIGDAEIFRLLINLNGRPYYLVVLMDPATTGILGGRSTLLFPGIALIPLTLMLLFVIIFSLRIIRSIDSKILKLEKATREIAGGNLDLEVPVPGTDKFASLAGSLERMRKKLKADEEYRARFIMSVSHDLKTPLSTIDGYLDALMEGFGEEPEKREKFYRIMKEKSLVLTDRISSLIGFARMSAGEWVSSMAPVRAGTFLENFIDEARLEAELRGFEIEVPELPPLDFELIMDEKLFHRALENLFQNAVKYSDERKAVLLKVEKDFDALRIRIGNYGRGIQPENREEVFDPFFRESSGRNEAGSGLGLSTVKHIVQAHGWKISLDSEPGGYTEFTVVIPFG